MNEFEAYEKILDHWHRVSRLERLNQMLYDELGGTLMYILEYAKKNNISLPNENLLWQMVANLDVTINAINTPITLQQPKRTPSEDNTTKLNNQNKHLDNEQQLKLSDVSSK